jgi:hypothetical protein
MVFTQGNTNTFQEPLRPDSDEFEISQFGAYENFGLPVYRSGLKWGSGDTVAAKYPTTLSDGMVMTRVDPTRYSAPQKAALNIKTDEFFDFAPDAASGPLYIVWGNKQSYEVSGLENILHTYDKTANPWTPTWAGSPTKPVYDPAYDVGAMGSRAINGIVGICEAWFGASLTNELSLSGYSAYDYITVSMGKFKKAVSTNYVIGQVEFKYTGTSRTKLRARFFNGTPFIMP